jgi:hypothetical protein
VISSDGWRLENGEKDNDWGEDQTLKIDADVRMAYAALIPCRTLNCGMRIHTCDSLAGCS